MPEFEIYPINLRHYKKNKQTNKSNRTKFTYVRVKNLESSLKGKQMKKHSDSFHCVLKNIFSSRLLVTSHVDQQSSRIGRKMSHVFCIVRTQDSHVLSRGQAIWKSVPKNLDFFWLLI